MLSIISFIQLPADDLVIGKTAAGLVVFLLVYRAVIFQFLLLLLPRHPQETLRDWRPAALQHPEVP